MPIKKNNPLNEELIQLSTPYKKLHALIENIKDQDIKDWTILYSLAYMCNCYKIKFNTDYVLSYSGSPSQCYEYKLFSRLWAMLRANSTNAIIVKNYIDWFFKNYDSKNPFRSVGALVKADLVVKYNAQKEKQSVPSMNTPLPDATKDIINSIEELKYVTTYGDLLYIKKAMDADSKNIPSIITNLFEALTNSGFDLSILNKVR